MENVRKKSRIWVVAMIAAAMFVTTAVPTFAAAPGKDSVTYLGSGKVEVEFDEDAQYKRLKITVRDFSNKKYSASIYRKSDDELKFRIKNYKAGKSYKFSISGVREEGTRSYGKVKGSFKIPKADVTASKAKKIALKQAGTTSSKVKNLKAVRDEEDGIVFYKVSFKTSKYSYRYFIALNGKVIEKKVTKLTAKNITASKAKSIALKDAGTTASEVRDLDVEKERDDGMTYYEVTFETWKYEYEYKISLKGKILRKDVERND